MASTEWTQFQRRYWYDTHLGFGLDVSRMGLDDAYRETMAPELALAFEAMDRLEVGEVANPDENRQVGHYWLRDPGRAPSPEQREAIETTLERIRTFVSAVHSGKIHPPRSEKFTSFLLIGIGGSALGPQLVSHAFASTRDRMNAHFIDNTDPDGIDRVLARLRPELKRTLVIVVSKSGGTQETRNAMYETALLFQRLELEFGPQTVAVTGEGSGLETLAREHGFLEIFPMWDWVGGRTSELSAVGLLPAALQGIPIDELLAGARAMDERTRQHDLDMNPAAQLALAWHRVGEGRGERDMVVLPYRDRLELMSRYLQQLVMESLGKKFDLRGEVVHQGLTVYGNKGSTDQHAYVQQLREGPDSFFVTFIEALRDRSAPGGFVEEDVTTGDYLLGFLLGTREALTEAGRPSVTITLAEITPRTVGALIALFERTVGLYASLIGINAYHQPGVEAGKKAASQVIDVQRQILAALRGDPSRKWKVEDVAEAVRAEAQVETVFRVLEHLSANPEHRVTKTPGFLVFAGTYSVSADDAGGS